MGAENDVILLRIHSWHLLVSGFYEGIMFSLGSVQLLHDPLRGRERGGVTKR